MAALEKFLSSTTVAALAFGGMVVSLHLGIVASVLMVTVFAHYSVKIDQIHERLGNADAPGKDQP